jgi:hypothetical protein
LLATSPSARAESPQPTTQTGIWLTFIPAIITAAVGLAGLLGLAKYLIEPWYTARALRRKYATALWIACVDLKIQLERIHKRILEGDRQMVDALKKIPHNDSWRDGSIRADWFTKEGYYTTNTAYKIAAVSAWLRIYQRELLFLPYSATQNFLSKLYAGADRLNTSFSTDTCLWHDYLNATGDGLVKRPSCADAASVLEPLSFAEFCERYTTDTRFLLFYEQVHMYIWFLADGRKTYLESVQNVLQSLDDLRSLLTREKLLRKDFVVTRPEINLEEMERRVT